MALSDDQKLSVFECLGVTFGPGGGTNINNATIHNGFGVMLNLTEMNTLRDQVSAYLATVSAAVEAKISGLVTAWDSVRLCTGSMEGGTIGEIQGVTLSFDEKRANIRQLMQVYVPAMDMANAIKRRTGQKTISFGVGR